MQINNIGIIIQARMKSERLPGKVLMPLPFLSGELILGSIVKSLRKINGHIIIATSVNIENKPISQFALDNGIEIYEGDEEDVLSRFIDLQRKYNFEHVIRITSDNPFVDSRTIQNTLNYHLNNENDYTHSEGMPLGMNVEVFNGISLIDSLGYIADENDREHVTLALKRESKFKKGIYKIGESLDDIRLTVDTVQDYMVANIVAQIRNHTSLEGVDLIKHIKKAYPWVFTGNIYINQKNSKSDLVNEIHDAIFLLEKLEFNRTVSLLKNSSY